MQFFEIHLGNDVIRVGPLGSRIVSTLMIIAVPFGAG